MLPGLTPARDPAPCRRCVEARRDAVAPL